MASYAAVLVFLILGVLATSCFAQEPGAEPTQPPLEKYHGAQEKYTDGPGNEGPPDAQEKYTDGEGSPNGEHKYEFGPGGQEKYADGEDSPNGEHKYEFGPSSQEKYTDDEGSPNGEHKYEFGPGAQENYTDGEGSPNGEHKYEFGPGTQDKYTDGKGSPYGEHSTNSDLAVPMGILLLSALSEFVLMFPIRTAFAIDILLLSARSEFVLMFPIRTAFAIGILHQEMFPFMLLYFCHYIPMARFYEVEILDLQKIMINQAVDVCHLTTSSWSRNHPAFVELGSTPREIEVCHWIYENDMSWTANAN
ncbi:BURP domain protein [Medicago truncatula]|uniref:BURP domain protein n=1 Tax=Medicago truncatula TaxID=3880 RepID=G7JZ09_MEDTR|nr:BURP domain protein [Medicago truncatula]